MLPGESRGLSRKVKKRSWARKQREKKDTW